MNYLNITYPDISNGPGCRVTVWIPGCNRKCPGCHTPWTHDYNAGKEFTTDTFDELCKILNKDYITGLTISGGDPLMQSDEILFDLCQLVHDIKELYPHKTIWLYTGYNINELNETQWGVIRYCDYVVEGPFVEQLKDTTLAFRGSSNQKITKIINQYY
jgi:anaerobic ribonucleoside-triphosphate reductase activating protein